MRTQRSIPVFFTFCLLLALCGADSAYPLALNECITRSLDNGKLVQAYENQIKAAIYDYKKQRSELLPQTVATTGVDHLWYSPKADLDPLSGFVGKVGVELSMDLQKLIASYPELARLEIEKSELLKTITRNVIRKEVTQDYYTLYVLLKKKKDYEGVDSYFGDHIKDVLKLQDSGVDVKLDLIRAQVQQNSIHVSMSNINGEISKALISLNSRMASDFKESDFASMTEPELPEATAQAIFNENEPKTEAEIQTSYVERVEAGYAKKLSDIYQLKLDASEVKIAKEAFRQSQFYYIPSLQFGAEHNIHTIDPTVEAYRLSLSMSLNIFDFPQKEFEKRKLERTYAYQKDVFDENERKLKVQIDQLITDIENLQTTYKNAVANLGGATQIIVTAKTYYEQGKIKESDLLSVSSEYLAAKEQFYEALSNYLNKKAELDFLLEGIKI